MDLHGRSDRHESRPVNLETRPGMEAGRRSGGPPSQRMLSNSNPSQPSQLILANSNPPPPPSQLNLANSNTPSTKPVAVRSVPYKKPQREPPKECVSIFISLKSFCCLTVFFANPAVLLYADPDPTVF